jgi:hypothetical protein
MEYIRWNIYPCLFSVCNETSRVANHTATVSKLMYEIEKKFKFIFNYVVF